MPVANNSAPSYIHAGLADAAAADAAAANAAEPAIAAKTRSGPPKWRSTALRVFLRKSTLHGAFVWARKGALTKNAGFRPGQRRPSARTPRPSRRRRRRRRSRPAWTRAFCHCPSPIAFTRRIPMVTRNHGGSLQSQEMPVASNSAPSATRSRSPPAWACRSGTSRRRRRGESTLFTRPRMQSLIQLSV
jgi:hypothetical protein